MEFHLKSDKQMFITVIEICEKYASVNIFALQLRKQNIFALKFHGREMRFSVYYRELPNMTHVQNYDNTVPLFILLYLVLCCFFVVTKF